MNFQEKTRIFIREKRIALGLTQTEFAEIIFGNSSRSRIAQIENGRDITLTTLNTICEKLNVDINFIEL